MFSQSSPPTYFESIEYTPFEPRAELLDNCAIVPRSGMLLGDLRWTRLTVYSNPIVRTRALAVTAMSIAKRRLSKLETSHKYGIIHSVWTAGYYHWITESLPRALIMKDFFPDSTPILPSRKYNIYEDSLRHMGFDHIAYFPEGKNVIICRPIVTECPRRFGTTSPSLLRKVRDNIKIGLKICCPPKRARFIYVSRRKSRGRFVLNEEQVVHLLVSLGFEIVFFEDLPFDQQVRMMHEAIVLISIHGAALTNMLFMPPGGKVIELLPMRHGIFDYNSSRSSFQHDSCYIRLADAMGHEYLSIQCPSDAGKYSRTHMANLSIDMQQFEKTVREFLSSKARAVPIGRYCKNH